MNFANLVARGNSTLSRDEFLQQSYDFIKIKIIQSSAVNNNVDVEILHRLLDMEAFKLSWTETNNKDRYYTPMGIMAVFVICCINLTLLLSLCTIKYIHNILLSVSPVRKMDINYWFNNMVPM